MSAGGGPFLRGAAAGSRPCPSCDHGIIARSTLPDPLDLVVAVGLAQPLELGPAGTVLGQPFPGEAAVRISSRMRRISARVSSVMTRGPRV